MHLAAPTPGTMIAGKYRVERTLGEGGMAVVVEATHIALGQRVAIKLLRGESARAPEVVERFRREAQIAAQLPGDHIARVTDLGVADSGEPFLVMELLVGRDLEAELTVRNAFPVVEAVDTMLQACEGVAEAHAAGLVHRDLKPGNLFLTRRRDGSAVVKVLDFGISKASSGGNQSLTQTTSNFGTPLYMSPEQIQSAKHVDARSDQHALGAILYALLTGQPPFNAETLTALAVVIATKLPVPARQVRPEIPIGLEAALDRALQKNPRDRFADIGAFARAIAAYGGPTAAASLRTIESALYSDEPSQISNVTDVRGMAAAAGIGFGAAARVQPIASPPSDAAVTSPGGIAGQTSVSLSTAIRNQPRTTMPTQQKRFLLAGGVAAVVVLALGMIALALHKPELRGDVMPASPGVEATTLPTIAETAAPTVDPGAPSPAARLEPGGAATAEPATSATAEPSAEPSAKATTKGTAKHPTTKTPGKAPVKDKDRAAEVFGARRN